MRNCKEQTEFILEKYEEKIKAAKRNKKVFGSVAMSFLCLALILSSGFVFGILKLPEGGAINTGEDAASVEAGNQSNDPPRSTDTVIWGGKDIPEPQERFYSVTWNGIEISCPLYELLNGNTDKDAVFAVVVTQKDSSMNARYEGKTVSEWLREIEKSQKLIHKYGGLLKEGEDLKYGDLLWTTGTQNGRKWAKELYDERISYYGKEFLDIYIVDGEFLAEKLKADEEECAKAFAAELERVSANIQIAIRNQTALNAGTDEKVFKNLGFDTALVSGQLYIFASEGQLAGIDCADKDKYFFDAALREGYTDGQGCDLAEFSRIF